jgi:AraC-like DNA-binding protein
MLNPDQVFVTLRQVPPWYRNTIRAYPYCYLFFIRHGAFFLENSGGNHVIHPGQVVFCRQGSDFTVSTDARAYHCLSITVQDPIPPEGQGETDFFKASTEILTLVEWFHSELLAPDPAHEKIRQMWALSLWEMSLATWRKRLPPTQAFSESQFWVSRLEAVIRGAIYTDKNLKELTTPLDRSYRQLMRDFIQIVGLTPKTFQTRCKIEEAKRLLSETEFTATQIALELGFSSSQHFSGLFKRMTGWTPESFRNSPF